MDAVYYVYINQYTYFETFENPNLSAKSKRSHEIYETSRPASRAYHIGWSGRYTRVSQMPSTIYCIVYIHAVYIYIYT